LVNNENRVVIIGAGPAGLSAAYELSKQNMTSLVLEATEAVGGISRTARYKGYLFDMGGHRFFSKVRLVNQMWDDVLKGDLLTRRRLSRIYYKSRFFYYPLEPMNALVGLGLLEALGCGLSYVKSWLFPAKPESDFETWVCNRFGKRLFQIFFKSYTEKVWGMPCNKIRAEWAAQRIRGLSLVSLVWNALSFRENKTSTIKTLIHEFKYPRKGPGMMWERTKEIIEERGSKVVFHAPVEKIYWQPGSVTAVRAGGRVYRGEHFVSSMPIRELIGALDPAPPQYLSEARFDFNYRDFLTVALIVKGKNLFPDNWIYIHDPRVRVGRIQNYNNWSPEMTPDDASTCLGLEYFCSEGDDLCAMADGDLLALAKREIGKLGLADPNAVIDGTVVRVPKAYPIYDDKYTRGLAAIRRFLSCVPNLQLTGRNGMHRYNNQDHSMLTGILAARNIAGARYDLWDINVDTEYHEEGGEITEEELRGLAASQPLVPRAGFSASAGG
jgi:protoporphyrinogen oxidase